MSTETYINTPLPQEVAEALKRQAAENGRRPSRELAQIAIRALARRTRNYAAKVQ